MSDQTNQASDLAQRLRGITRGRTAIDVAQFQFIGLAEIERAYGPKWPAHKARIHEIARGFLEKRIAGSDVMVEGADGFLVVFGSMSGRESEIAALGLSHGLNEFFLGELREGGAPRVSVELAAMPADVLVNTFGNLEVVPPFGAAPDESADANPIDWRYQPVWDVRREALTSYYVVPYQRETGRRIPGYLFDAPDTRTNFAAVDEASLRKSEAAIRQLFLSGQRAFVGVSLHASSLSNGATRMRLMALLDSFDRELFRYRLVKIAGVAPGFPRLYLSEIMSALKPRIPNVVIGAAWDESDLYSLVHSGAVAVGFALPETAAGRNPVVAQSQLVAKIRAGADCAHAAKKTFFVEGGIGRDLVIRLGAVGVDNISAPAIWTPVAAPAGVVKWSADRLVNLAA